MLKNTRSNDTFVSILSDGLLHLAATESTPGAVKREYETSDGKKGSKWELVYTELTGMITKIAFRDGDFGKSLQLSVTDEEDSTIVLSVNTQSNFAEDLMKKLPAIDLKKSVKIAPYSFEDEKGKKKRGVTIYQEEEKIQNYFYSVKSKKNIHGYPDPKVKKGKPFSKEQWKMYFMEARLFLIEFITEHFNITDEVDTSDAKLEEMVNDAAKALD